MYTPPFTISSKIVNLIAKISAMSERYTMLIEQDTSLRLRKVNRIKTIHSSLAIEGNNLSEGQVHDIINGKDVVAPIREIQEVKNAIDTYEMFSQLNPLFAHLPVENIVFANQKAYYDAISASTAKGESTPFIEFMLGEILAALTRNQTYEQPAEVEYVPIKISNIFPNNIPNIFPNNIPNIFPNKFRNRYPSIAVAVWYVGSLLNNAPGASADEIGEALGLTGRTVRNYIAKLRKLGIIERIGSNKTGYWKVDFNAEQ